MASQGPYSPPSRGAKPMEIVSSKGASSCAEHVFDTLLCDSVAEVFSAVLGKIAGQALLDAVKRYTSLELQELAEKPTLVDEALRAHMGRAAKVLERKILRAVSGKASAGVPPTENDQFDFADEIEKVREQFLRRKKAANRPHPLE